MDISLSLSDTEITALRAHAIEAKTSVNQIVVTAVRQWMDRRSDLRDHVNRIVQEDAELLRRLSE